MKRLFPALATRLLRNEADRRDMLDGLLWQIPASPISDWQRADFSRMVSLMSAPIAATGARWLATFSHTPLFLWLRPAMKCGRCCSPCSQISQCDFVIRLLGSCERDKIEFHASGTGLSLFPERSNAKRDSVLLPMTTLVISSYPQLKAPLFLKLDVQGAELGVLCGAKNALFF
jgi:hypothetical protein